MYCVRTIYRCTPMYRNGFWHSIQSYFYSHRDRTNVNDKCHRKNDYTTAQIPTTNAACQCYILLLSHSSTVHSEIFIKMMERLSKSGTEVSSDLITCHWGSCCWRPNLTSCVDLKLTKANDGWRCQRASVVAADLHNFNSSDRYRSTAVTILLVRSWMSSHTHGRRNRRLWGTLFPTFRARGYRGYRGYNENYLLDE